ncbi:class I SAM-dependent methyltransferase [Niveibacterium sp.]|uniref:class I SAM-dependent DNA methyltransferase n=1 Tax=Niveibacterium sp. TaxID=2017444 RepID=UPI0035B2B2E2
MFAIGSAMPASDVCRESVETFNKLADRYAAKYFALTQYDRYYAMLADRMPTGGSVIDIACGPGNVAAHLKRVRPDLSVVGIDMAPRMIDEARRRVPDVAFHVADCREMTGVGCGFHGAAFAFGLSYLPDVDARRFFAALRRVLADDAFLLLTCVTGPEGAARYEQSSSGDRVFMVYRSPDAIVELVESHGFSVEFCEQMPSPGNASVATTDLAILAKRVPASAASTSDDEAG